jgi:hypothetical protein
LMVFAIESLIRESNCECVLCYKTVRKKLEQSGTQAKVKSFLCNA